MIFSVVCISSTNSPEHRNWRGGGYEGAPLMRLFKANQPYLSEEDRAAAMRLTNIASRYRTESSDNPAGENDSSSSEDAETPEIRQ